MDAITQSLWITLVSMGLVFASLLLLAGAMSLMTRLFRDREESLAPVPSGEATKEDEKARAAAAAVAIALAGQSQSAARPLTLPEPALIGAWQLGMRTRQMTQKGETSRRSK
ncbi:MAG: hypothetical protein JETCAE02_19330 [Anaerolineaceae bacterium]|jgi:Na+-transporting methylmalonyl-CoA/oxaloacetate decarboxylase gamma subunit|nr:hypothetical protein [Anaerolineae bacterium]MBL1170964.1 hypothetical protein [Chloroflexota bacterium]MBV6467324.1 hypothetical protein [Anaerolineales bacterium]OQY86182.1 MAG: hypothetical protein B6D40_01910 [Anaerolineae bacterium UTCFX3]GER79903.1 conserved hypothetical protein [Candidatus Denitrolinea symbiosum]GJQ39521.1 MAG: hypothetical protein JETCAE02_19330 [Anaerolineaceae bacterium]